MSHAPMQLSRLGSTRPSGFVPHVLSLTFNLSCLAMRIRHCWTTSCACSAFALWGVVRSVMLGLADALACEMCFGYLCLPALCFCTERFACNPCQFSLYALGVRMWFLFCLPLKRYPCGLLGLIHPLPLHGLVVAFVVLRMSPF